MNVKIQIYFWNKRPMNYVFLYLEKKTLSNIWFYSNLYQQNYPMSPWNKKTKGITGSKQNRDIRFLHLSCGHCSVSSDLCFVCFSRCMDQNTIFFTTSYAPVLSHLPNGTTSSAPYSSPATSPLTLLMLLVDTHGMGLFQRWYDTYCPWHLAQEGHTSKWHTQQGHCQWGLFVDQTSCPRQPLPGYCIPKGLCCHQQSLSTSHPQQTPDRNPLCSSSLSLVPSISFLYIKESVAILLMFSFSQSCF